MNNLCLWDSGLTALKKAKLELALNVNTGSVLDIGSGENPLAYSFAYVGNVLEINFSDKNPEVVNHIKKKIADLSPDNLNETELALLKNLGIETNKTLENILDKTNDIIEFDFTKSNLSKTFDFITAFECLASVNSFDDFNNAVLNLAQMLNKNGHLIGLSTRYLEKTPTTLELIKSSNEGYLNPCLNDYNKAFANANLEILTLEKRELKNVNNYNEMVVFNVRKL